MNAHAQNHDGLPVSFRSGSQWYCVRTNIKSEHRSVQSLKEAGFDTFLPLAVKWILHARAKKERTYPLFPRYLFVHIDPSKQGFWPVKHCQGVECLLSNNGVPQSIPDKLIDRIRSAEDIGLFDDTSAVKRLKEGDAVRIIEGPFSETVCKLVDASNKQRCEILMAAFGQMTTTYAPLALLRPA